MRRIGHIGLMRLIGIVLLFFSIGFNLWTYRMEPTAKTDPNDNTFQYALVDRTNQIWDYVQQRCANEKLKILNVKVPNFPLCIFHFTLLFDHWVPNWAQGYNLPYYYSHIPQITIVASWRLLSRFTFHVSLFTFYHIIIYLLLCFFPLSVFLALRIIGLSWVSAGVGALIASHLSTDGLYGLDPSSFLWRGYGLSSQLFAMIWLPLTIAYSYRYFAQNPKHEVLNLGFRISPAIPPILMLAFTTSGHLGIGIIAFISIAVLAISSIFSSLSNLNILSDVGNLLKKLILLYSGVLLLLGYWIIPILLGGNFHNISVWDPIWKFDSYGYREVLKNLLNGDLFDFGRFPILTIATFFGMYCAVSAKIIALRSSEVTNKQSLPLSPYTPFSILFLFWLLFYFGRTTWGGLVNLIPSMEEFHLSRFIVGIHIAGLFLIPIGIDFLLKKFKSVQYVLSALLVLSVLFLVFPQTIRYSTYNDTLITKANENFTNVDADTSLLLSTLNSQLSTNPGRVFAGRGGSWGKDFRVAETPMYMYISTFGIPTLTWLPETWSPNSDTEQYFSEDVAAHYSLYNIKYVVTPASPETSSQGGPIDLPKDKIQPFWKPLAAGKTWRLYTVDIGDLSHLSNIGNLSYGYISSGIRPAIVSSDKQNFTNVVRLWIQSDTHTKGLYPELTFDKTYPKTFGLPNFRMLDEVTYQVPDGSTHNLFAEVPRYLSPPSPAGVFAKEGISVLSQFSDSNMIFRATVDVPQGCTECIVILHQTYHPSWKATVDGKPAQTMIVFPFYTAVKLENAGRHEIIFSYQPSRIKITLLLVSLMSFAVLFLSHSKHYFCTLKD